MVSAGKLLRSWQYKTVFSAKEVGAFQHTAGHIDWNDGSKLTQAGLELTVHGGKRTLVLDPKASTLR